MAGFLDDVGSFFDGLGGDSNSDESSSSQSELVEEIDGVYTGSKRIITIPAKTMKSGGLRLYCNLFLMGVQNTPEKGCWKASQSDNSEVNLRYVDLSGSIIIRFTEDGITVDRLGSSPSTKYLIAESMILNGFLDELHSIVYGGDVSEQNRLLTLMESDVIEKARGFVSFGWTIIRADWRQKILMNMGGGWNCDAWLSHEEYIQNTRWVWWLRQISRL